MHLWKQTRTLGFILVIISASATLARSQEKAKFEISATEKAILDLTNKERADQNLPPLKPNAKLFYAARLHSKNMAVTKQFTHILDNKNPIHRAQEYGYPVPFVGENIALGSLPPKQVVALWMNSPQHKENILKSQYTEIGIGAYKVANGEIYWTQVFGASKEAKNPPDLVVGKVEFPEPPEPGKKKPQVKPDPGKPDPGKPDPAPKPANSDPAKVPLVKTYTLTKTDKDDGLLKGRPSKIIQIHLEAGKNYTIELTSAQFNPYLFLKDDHGKIIAHEGSSGGDNSRINFQPKQSGTYRIVLTPQMIGSSGSCALQVREK